MKHSFIYVTTKDIEEAKLIAKALVEEKLVACSNIIDKITSFYYWEGKLQQDQEAALFAKTTKSKLNKVIEKVKQLHSYSCPCIISAPIEGGNPDFLSWITAQVK